jgi:hypothetical protein
MDLTQVLLEILLPAGANPIFCGTSHARAHAARYTQPRWPTKMQ